MKNMDPSILADREVKWGAWSKGQDFQCSWKVTVTDWKSDFRNTSA